MRDRRHGFCYQEVPAVRLLHERFEGKERNTALGIYQALTFIANERRSREDFSASRSEVASLAGVSRVTLDRYAAEFESLGLIEVDRQRVGEFTNLPNAWTLLSGEAPSSVAELGVVQPTDQYRQQQEEKQEGGDEWKEWLEHYHATTNRTAVRGSASAIRSFTARRAEGYPLADLKLATEGCHGDDYLRKNGFDVPVTILRPSNLDRYIELGRTQSTDDDGFGGAAAAA